MFAVLAQRDEIAKLKLQGQTQTQANLEKIRGGRPVRPERRMIGSLLRKRLFCFHQRSGEQGGGVPAAD